MYQSARVACWGTLIESLHLSCRHASASSVPSQFSRPGEGYESHKIDTLFKTLIYLRNVAINILGAIADTYRKHSYGRYLNVSESDILHASSIPH